MDLHLPRGMNYRGGLAEQTVGLVLRRSRRVASLDFLGGMGDSFTVKERRFRRFLLTAAAAAIALGSLWFAFGGLVSNPTSGQADRSVQKRGSKAFSTSWQDETQYIVESVIGDLAGMSMFASTGGQFEAGEISVAAEESTRGEILSYNAKVGLPDGRVVDGSVELAGSVWDPQSYSGIAGSLWNGERERVSESGVDTPRLIEKLCTPTPAVLLEIDEELSSLIRSNPAAAELHVDAAILLGAFAMREASGKFFTIRAELNRMTAHLAFAKSLGNSSNGGVDEEGGPWMLAKAILLALQNNQREALAVLEKLPEGSAYEAWGRALRARVTGDYRPLRDSPHATLLEAREAFRAGCSLAGPSSIVGDKNWGGILKVWNETPGGGDLPDWLRIAAGGDRTISVGNSLYRESSLLRAEIAETGYVRGRFHGKRSDKKDLAEDLNMQVVPFGVREDGEKHGQQRVLGWPFWAGQFQRHICSAVVEEACFLQDDLAVDEGARKFRTEAGAQFSNLRLYPFVRVVSAVENGDYRNAQDEARRVMLSSPQEVGPEIWNHTCYENPHTDLYVPPPHAYVNEWHRHNPPTGTAYDPLPRMNQPSLVDGAGAVERLEALHRMAPYDPNISHNLLRIKAGGSPEELSFQQLFDVYAPIGEYYPMAAIRLAEASKQDPAEYERWMRRAIAMAPDAKERLALYYRDNGRDKEAVDLLLEWIGGTTDLVPGDVSSYVVNYLEDEGRTGEALEVAEELAKSYSGGSLRTKAGLLERRGDWEGAYGEHLKIAERYNDKSSLKAFFLRTIAADGGVVPDQFREKARKGLAELGFPEAAGMLVALRPSGNPPDKGVLVQINDVSTQAVGLKQGDVIVAARGYRVEDWESFKFLRELWSDKPYALTVWRDGFYVNIPPIRPWHLFSADFESYRRR